MVKWFARLRGAHKGAGLVEYGILVGLIAVLAIGSVTFLGQTTRDTFETVSTTPSSSITPTPALGEVEEWSFVYTLDQATIDGGIEFYMFVLATGANTNGSLDNLNITYTP